MGLKVRDLDVTSGEIIINIDESLLAKSKTKSDISESSDLGGRSYTESLLDKRSQKDEKSQLSRKRPTLLLPDKVKGVICVFSYCIIT